MSLRQLLNGVRLQTLPHLRVSYLSSSADPCFLVNGKDEKVGVASKEECHLLSNIHSGMLHRAFSLFLFSNDRRSLLLQKRADIKLTFPKMTSNTCCSHPQPNFKGEEEEAGAIGAKRAASRRLSFELALPADAVKPTDLHYITRIHYYVRNVPEDNLLGEHEVDYIFFAFADLPVEAPNPAEVSRCWYASRDEVQTAMLQRPQDFTPWFRLIADNFLFKWWANIDNLESIMDQNTIHNFCVLKF